jgi:hypothetical protein
MGRYALGESPVADEKPHLDIAIQGSLGEVDRGHKHCLVIGDHGLGMERTAGTPVRAFEDPSRNAAALVRPVGFSEPVPKSSHELLRCGRRRRGPDIPIRDNTPRHHSGHSID